MQLLHRHLECTGEGAQVGGWSTGDFDCLNAERLLLVKVSLLTISGFRNDWKDNVKDSWRHYL